MIDHKHEQNNKKVKGDGGAIGLTENSVQLLQWIVCGPEVACVVEEFNSLVFLHTKMMEIIDDIMNRRLEVFKLTLISS